MKKSDVYYADLPSPTGSEQGGFRPVLVFQNHTINQYTQTVIIIPFTTNLKRLKMPSSVFISKGSGGLSADSVALCHQIAVISLKRLRNYIGTLPDDLIKQIDEKLLFTLGVSE
jgi:mRNA interferase MazF